MIVTGDTKRLLIGIWILAALITLAYSGQALLVLFSPPIMGYSSTVKSVILKKQQLAAMMAETESAEAKADLLTIAAGLDKTTPLEEEEEEEEEESIRMPPLMPSANPVSFDQAPKPPLLRGVFRTMDSRGKMYLRALLDSELLAENDRIGDFTVQRISEKGVLLTKESVSLFLPSPDVPFCLTREE